MKSRFLDVPFLPSSKVTVCAVSQTDRGVIAALKALQIRVIEITPNLLLPKPVNSHTDMLLHHAGKDKIFVSGEFEYVKELRELGFVTEKTDKQFSDKYPDDIQLNIVNLNGMIFCNEKYCVNNVTRYYKKEGYLFKNIAQGYSKCSTCIVNNKAVITSDDSIYNAALNSGIDVLKIRCGFIDLPGYDYGFIGGASGLIDKNLLAFTGNIKLHPDYEKIKLFTDFYEVDIISLTDNNLNDIGGIIPLMESSEEK